MKAAAKKKRPRRPVYFVVARAGDVPREAGVLVPLTKWDQRTMRDRKLGVGVEVRADLKKPRNPKFNRLTHAIGALCAEQIEDFAGMDAHAVLKKIQEDADIFCDKAFVDASPVIKIVVSVTRTMLGDAIADKVAKALAVVKKIALKEARSLSFDSMDESEFQQFVSRAYAHLRVTYWPNMTDDEVARMVEIYEETA
jgi:hypothetical protein